MLDTHATTGKLGDLWCSLMHDSPMWPIHAEYRCRTCGRHYPVPWAEPRTRLLRSAVPLLFVLALTLVPPARAADPEIVESNSAASLALARYAAGLEHASPWTLETIEIDAALPKMEKKGRLRAIRRLVPFSKPEYQVLEFGGDKTVRQQVILRYLSAEVRAAAIPAPSVAISTANYKFHYKGTVNHNGTVAYAFSITPRKKSEGLIKGELWLDGDTGVAVRQSGRLVKTPSIFVKRVDVDREATVRNGVVEMRVTHLSVDARLVGLAELTVRETPYVEIASVK